MTSFMYISGAIISGFTAIAMIAYFTRDDIYFRGDDYVMAVLGVIIAAVAWPIVVPVSLVGGGIAAIIALARGDLKLQKIKLPKIKITDV